MTRDTERKEFETMQALVKAADCAHPSQAAIDALQQGFHDYPDLWMMAGDLAWQARLHAIKETESTPALQVSVQQGVAVIRRELGYATAPRLEQLLIDQVMMCWLRMGMTEYAYTDRMTKGTHSSETGLYWERRLSMVQARYLQACEVLARVRRLAQGTPLQVNIGGQQVNVVGNMGQGGAERAQERQR